jgi:hypothetical protein
MVFSKLRQSEKYFQGNPLFGEQFRTWPKGHGQPARLCAGLARHDPTARIARPSPHSGLTFHPSALFSPLHPVKCAAYFTGAATS